MKFPLELITPAMVAEAIHNEETIRYMDAVPTMTYSEEDAAGFLDFLRATKEASTELELGIFDKATGRYIGMCTLENINAEQGSCELGYWLDNTYTGRGYMTECASAVLSYAADELHMSTINAFVITEHTKSIRLLERLGFTQKERLLNNTENKGEMVDRYWYQLMLKP